ncbi:homoserine dehydrogenase [Euhalothece natronophila Z-M001]|uniref:Homoserine dehydrogenase n=1 Tax=Euhalothece natronophila Z-M001 TaxID=522448 RepID=A0A5B8NJG0_9CHRO|nr:homoserine dehydrogenase [Euhalothece natronophila]QDZ39422.1 homoserine dehydrogenase [Euhalothece natronophila Z-M001]
MVEALKIGLLGLGTVGTATAEILQSPERRNPVLNDITIAKVGVSNLEKPRQVQFPEGVLTTDLEGIVNDPNIDVIIELIGGLEPARSLILQAIAKGKHIVTANKAVISRYGEEIYHAAEQAGVYVFIEAAVGGGIPVIRPLQQALSVNRIQSILGIINGTTNFILTKMGAEGSDFAEVLTEAQELGYAEADPSADVDGYDAADKITILATLAFEEQVNLEDVSCEGIRQVSAVDIKYAKQLGFEIKLLAIAQRDETGLQVRVHPTLVPKDHPLASIDGVNNAILVEGDPLGQVMFYGPGAGGGATASAVVSDLMNIAAMVKTTASVNPLMKIPQHPAGQLVPIQELVTRFYARIICVDRPGVIGNLGTCFGKHNVSLESIVQIDFNHGIAEVVVVTHNVKEENFRKALAEIPQLEAIDQIQIPSVLRVLRENL